MSPPIAVQASSDSGDHVVGFGNIQVLITKDEPDGWFAQGVEIDYFAQGDSPEEVMKNFGRGFALTVGLYLENHGSIEKMLKWAPMEEYKGLMSGKTYQFTQVSLHEIAPQQTLDSAELPFHNINFGFPLGTEIPQLTA